MAYDTYFGSTPVNDWTANGPAEGGHNFIDRINAQQADVDAQKQQLANQREVANQARDAYQQAYQNQRGYGDLYSEAKASEGVDDAKAQYQHSLDAVNSTARAMNRLPSSINAGSNVVLNSNQRNAALGNQMTKYQGVLNDWARQNQGDLSKYQTALGAAQNLAGQNMAEQQARVSLALQNKQQELNAVNEAYNQLMNEKAVVQQIYGDMFNDEYNHWQQVFQTWAKNLEEEGNRYAQAQETARNNAKIAAQNYATDVSKYLGSGYTWDGNGWSSPQKVDTSKAVFQDNLNKLYSQYKGEIDDLNNNSFWNYFNPFLGLTGDSASQKAVRAKEMQNKGFEDYLYNNAPWLQKDLREKYSDLLGYYGLQ